MDAPCLFCSIVKKELPSHPVWEDEKFLAFLSIFPNTDGVTVLIPKDHYGSYVCNAPDEVVMNLMKHAKLIAKKIEHAFDDVGRCSFVFEGFGVDHLHMKIFPMHGTTMSEWKPIHSNIKTFFETYPGYISTHDADRALDEKLAGLAEKIRGAE